jgi:hypothetical protein
MRLVSKFWQSIAASWLNLKLANSLISFLVWFGWQTYTSSTGLLVSLIWAVLAILLLIQQSILWNLPNIQPNLQATRVQNSATKNLYYPKIKTFEIEKSWCHKIYLNFAKYPTHRDLAINASLCDAAFLKQFSANQAWDVAVKQDPNAKIFKLPGAI